MARRNWSYNELVVAFNLYCKTPFGKIHIRNPEIVTLARLLGRTPSAVSWKLANFARLDPALQARSIVGASHGGKGDLKIWEEFNNDWERLSYESEKLLEKLTGKRIEDSFIDKDELPREGKEREAVVRVRVNQGFFRSAVLAAYDMKCCVSNLMVPDLLIASHIKPWSKDKDNRINPRNGLCLNALHDKAFDRGLMTITAEYDVKLSKALVKLEKDDAVKNFLLKYEGSKITLPNRFLPDPVFIKYHNKNIFQG